jgi:hypothetical protein
MDHHNDNASPSSPPTSSRPSSWIPSYSSSTQYWERLSPVVPGSPETSESRQWELFNQLRKDLSDYFGFLHGEITGLRMEIQRTNSRLDSLTSHVDNRCTSLSNDIQTVIQEEAEHTKDRFQNLGDFCRELTIFADSHIQEIPKAIDELKSKLDVPHSKREYPLTPPESPMSETPNATPMHTDETKSESTNSEVPTPKIIPVYDERIKAKRKTSKRIPIRCAIGAMPYSGSYASYVPGVLVKGRVSTISKDYIPPGVTMTTTDSKCKVTLPVYLANAATLSRDKRRGNALILQLRIEFQVLENSSTVFTIGQDAIKAHGYNLDIDRRRNVIVITNVTNNFKMKPFRIPIIENPSRSSQPPTDSQPQCSREISTKPLRTNITLTTPTSTTSMPMKSFASHHPPSIDSHSPVGRQGLYDQPLAKRMPTDECFLKRREVLDSDHSFANHHPTMNANISTGQTPSNVHEPPNISRAEAMHNLTSEMRQIRSKIRTILVGDNPLPAETLEELQIQHKEKSRLYNLLACPP